MESGVTVRTVAFERLVSELAEHHQLFVMDRKGTSIREQVFAGNPCFLLTQPREPPPEANLSRWIPPPDRALHGPERERRSDSEDH